MDGDPPGCGKTVVGVGLSNALSWIRKVLIVPPAHLKVNWKREWVKWCTKGLTVDIVRTKAKSKTERLEDGTKTVRRWTEQFFPETDVVIINSSQAEHSSAPETIENQRMTR